MNESFVHLPLKNTSTLSFETFFINECFPYCNRLNKIISLTVLGISSFTTACLTIILNTHVFVREHANDKLKRVIKSTQVGAKEYIAFVTIWLFMLLTVQCIVRLAFLKGHFGKNLKVSLKKWDDSWQTMWQTIWFLNYHNKASLKRRTETLEQWCT